MSFTNKHVIRVTIDNCVCVLKFKANIETEEPNGKCSSQLILPPVSRNSTVEKSKHKQTEGTIGG